MAISGVLGAGALLATLWLEHRTALALPTPTGPFAVGRVISDWRDDATPDPRAPMRGATRELLVWVWYPAVTPPPGDAPSDYLPAPMRVAVARARGSLISTFLTRDLANVRAHSVPDLAVSPERRTYPVVLLRGGASAEVWNYTTLAEDLASHGYVVVGADAPYRTNVVVFPDGRVVRRAPANDPERALGAPDSARRIDRLVAAWTGDLTFVLDGLQHVNAGDGSGPASLARLAGRLDVGHVGVFGHSFGGATAAEFCRDDPRCTAGIDIDGALVGPVVRDGLTRPFCFLLSDHGDAADADGRQIMADFRAVYDRLPARGRRFVVIPGAYHLGFSDDGALLKSHLVLRALRLIGVIGIDGRRQLALTADEVRRFFDAYLHGAPGSA